MGKMNLIQSIRDVADAYDAFIIDLWGVMHDGNALYPGALEAFQALRATGKPIVFLSNAPRKAEKAEEKLASLGIPREDYAAMITSGQVAYDQLSRSQTLGMYYFYLGPSKDEDVLDGLEGYTKVSDPANANFILNAGFEVDYQPVEGIEPLLEKLVLLKLPLLCINPDMEVVKQDGTRLLCAGWVAKRYETIGGKVMYVGKPYPAVYDASMAALGNPDNPLAIGDNLHTDILGANKRNIASLLITGGILKNEAGQPLSMSELAELCLEAGVNPTYFAESFAA